MAIRYKVIERAEPGVPGGGRRRYFASANVSGEFTLRDATKRIEKTSTINGADIYGVLYALIEVMKDALADGQIFRLGDLGSLRVSLSSQGFDSPDKVTPASIKGARVIFTPGTEIKDLLVSLDYKKLS
ncbi:MAG: DNA-binding protein [Bacteroidetes bacterium HGW-Bacteroidetes-4]|nr:MAG: DNA-binding protein [Bacteroidetes bacterium HGW-Bacteroidetes-4]